LNSFRRPEPATVYHGFARPLATKGSKRSAKGNFLEYGPKNKLESFAWKISDLQPILKSSIIFILCLPVLVIITAVLLLAGLKPDSIVRAFTDTYKHGFSQWDYRCDNVQCADIIFVQLLQIDTPQTSFLT